MADIKNLILPLKGDIIETLSAGDVVSFSGTMLTGRDAAHKRMTETLQKGEKLPFDVADQLFYFVGPAPAKPGQIINSAGPTTAYRIEPYFETMLQQGVRGFIGKGTLHQEAIDILVKYKACYFATTGGVAALIAKRISVVEIIAYEDLGTEAVRYITVNNFPAIVAVDSKGNSQFEYGRNKFAASIAH